ncbi:hypothetical protein Zmor_003098 [Zophobas morio]|uniref:PDZ domain-containing protein n=1 Tax=Zophobas morio TaxID=2755281 RepID=A0AA38M101_9CUCU|nr:hypothetical protein Zmor_003098 [Zophobas morio]
MSSELKSHPKARLCHIKKWDHFDGYGFNLHAEKGKPGQYIGKVDDSSPAEAAGLRQGDRILEVNGESIANKTHKQVVELIKNLPDETKLLVVDPHEDGIIPTEPELDDKQEKQNNDVNKKEQENGTLNLSMTAAELRAKLASKKKFDPKKESMDFKQKFDIVQKL